ncbi:MAG: hypothetical protein QXY75_02960 [Candidatus Bathyarchaeia archaeon]
MSEKKPQMDRIEEIEKVIREFIDLLGPTLNEIKDKLKVIEEANKISMDQFDIEKFVEHTTECPACKKRLETALNKYYRVKEVGRGKERRK